MDYTEPPSPNPECHRCDGAGKYRPHSDEARAIACGCGPVPLPVTPEVQAERDRIARIMHRAAGELWGLPTVRDALNGIASAIQDPNDNGWVRY